MKSNKIRFINYQFINFMLKDKALLDNTNLFSFSKYENNDKIILKHLQ